MISSRIEPIDHCTLMDVEVARQHARELKRQGYLVVRVVPAKSGGFVVRSQGLAVEFGRAS